MKKNKSFSEGGYRLFILFTMLYLSLSACNPAKKSSSASGNLQSPAANDDYFQEIGKEIGIEFVHSIGEKELKNIIESVGGGAAFLDYDQDGWIDLYVCSGTWVKGFNKEEKPEILPGNHLYHNRGNGTYEDVTENAKVGGPWYSMGVAVGDFNNDGFPDIFLSNYGPNVLLMNKGNGTFTDVTKKAGVAGGNECSVGAAWFDYDNDGLLDLYVGNYLFFDPNYKYYYAPDGFPGPLAYDSQKDVLYHNQGNGVFEDVTEKMGITDVDGRAMGVGAGDYDDDGYMDIMVANDHTRSYLFHNDSGKGFTDRAIMTGTAFGQSGESTVSMSVDFADYNGDGKLDMFISDDKYCSLYENQGNGLYKDQSYPAGIATAAGQFVGWSSSFIDYNNDGKPDIFKVNGALKHLYGHEDQLFENTGEGKFKDVSTERGAYFHKEYVGRGACFGDYDNDGDIDGYIVNLNSAGAFLRNNKGNQNNWITLNLIGTKSNRDGIGARIKVTSAGKEQLTFKKSTTGYLSQNDPRVHFGLEKNAGIDKIEIKWPSGKVQVLDNIKPNQILTVKEP